jgi:hypothetical protein
VKPENSNELNLAGNCALFQPLPRCEAVTAEKGHFIFVSKPSSHPLIQEYGTGAGVELATCEEAVREDISERAHTGTAWIHDVPLRGGKDALKVNRFEIEIRNAGNEVTDRTQQVTAARCQSSKRPRDAPLRSLGAFPSALARWAIPLALRAGCGNCGHVAPLVVPVQMFGIRPTRLCQRAASDSGEKQRPHRPDIVIGMSSENVAGAIVGTSGQSGKHRSRHPATVERRPSRPAAARAVRAFS